MIPSSLRLAIAFFGLVSLVSAAKVGRAEQAEPTSSPNIVVILADDLGWRDVGFHGSEIETPQIDRIAREGIELDRFYVQPTCSPTRAALMTGKSPMRLGINAPLGKNEKDGLPIDETILPEHLGRLGYQSLMVGKWHLGNYLPEQFPQARGFEHFYGFLSGGIGYWDHNHGGGHDWQRNGTTVREEGYTTTLIADEAVRLLTTRDRSRPTFLYVAFNAPHLPNEAPDGAIARYAHLEDPKRRIHAAMVSEMDAAMGRVIDTLEAEGMLADTILLFSSDNGGLVRSAVPGPLVALSDLVTSIFDRPIPIAGIEFVVANVEDGASDNAPLPEGKGSLAEGGTRVPAAIWWPAHLEGGTHVGFMTISDVMPTLLEAVGAKAAIPDDLDGSSQWGALTGSSPSETRDYVTTNPTGMAIYRPPWKLIVDDEPLLYDVFEDPLEEKNRALEHPEIVKSLATRAASWPAGERDSTSVLDFLWDPDSFGGPEDRAPWADVARERAAASR